MKLFYGWVIVGAAMVVTCVGFGAMFSLGVFLQPMTEAMGWSRTGISTAALLNFLCMGVGSFFWGTLSDRIGTDRKSTRLNSSHLVISYAVFCLKKKTVSYSNQIHSN